MNDEETKKLIEELEHYKKEKETIRKLVGRIGGKKGAKKERVINYIFIISLIVLFLTDLLRHVFKVDVPLPPLFSLEIGLLLVSIKIIWMIYKQTKVEHFQFWILNSIEFRLNDISKKLKEIEKKI